MTRPALSGDLAAHLPDFAARLRVGHGFLLGPGEVTDALRALSAVNVLNVHEVRDAWRAIFSTSPEQGRLFDAEFEAFFRWRLLDSPLMPPLLPPAPGGPPQEATAPAGTPQEGKKTTSTRAQDGQQMEAEALPGTTEGQAHDDPDAPDTDLTLFTRLSPYAGLGGQATGTQADLPALLRSARQLVQAVPLGRSRRLVPRPSGRKLDARRTVRRAARTAGDPVTLHWLGKPRRAPRFLIVLDGSRSMGQDARRLLVQDPDLTGERGRAVRTLLWLMEQDRAIGLISASSNGTSGGTGRPSNSAAWAITSCGGAGSLSQTL